METPTFRLCPANGVPAEQLAADFEAIPKLLRVDDVDPEARLGA